MWLPARGGIHRTLCAAPIIRVRLVAWSCGACVIAHARGGGLWVQRSRKKTQGVLQPAVLHSAHRPQGGARTVYTTDDFHRHVLPCCRAASSQPPPPFNSCLFPVHLSTLHAAGPAQT